MQVLKLETFKFVLMLNSKLESKLQSDELIYNFIIHITKNIFLIEYHMKYFSNYYLLIFQLANLFPLLT